LPPAGHELILPFGGVDVGNGQLTTGILKNFDVLTEGIFLPSIDEADDTGRVNNTAGKISLRLKLTG
jgi:hypothetical protein